MTLYKAPCWFRSEKQLFSPLYNFILLAKERHVCFFTRC